MRQRNETHACHRCYGTNIVLASYTAPLPQMQKQKAPVTSKLFQNFSNESNLLFQNQVTSYFEIQGCPNRKHEKKTFTWQWRNSKEKARLKGNGGLIKRQVQVYENLKLGDQFLLIDFKQLFTFKLLWFLFKVCFCLYLCLQFLAFALKNSVWLCSQLPIQMIL